MGLREGMAERFFGDILKRRVQNAVKAVDDRWWAQIGGATGPQDRPWATAAAQVGDSLAAWRDNPLARRIVALTTDYVVGDGITVSSERPEIADFIRRLWDHPLNRLGLRLYAWCDELTRSGELFLVLSTNPADGLSYVRSTPAVRIDGIETDADDLERELRCHELGGPSLASGTAGELGRWWPTPHTGEATEPVMLHFAINRPVGALRGEGDLTPLLPWLRRYREWLEDRVRVNRLRNSFVWQVRLSNADPEDVERKRQQYRQPPSAGSIIVSDDNEQWQAAGGGGGRQRREQRRQGAAPVDRGRRRGAAALPERGRIGHAGDGGGDGRPDLAPLPAPAAPLRQRAGGADRGGGGAGRPPWGSSPRRPTATLRLTHVLPDLTREDNLALAQAMRAAAEALGPLHDRGWLDDAAALRLVYRFAGEG